MTFKIELKDVSFAHEGSTPLFEGLNLTLNQSEIAAVVSAVGGGKSAFLKLCAGLLRPSGGEVIIDGKMFWNLTDKERNAIRANMSFDFQEGALIANMTVASNLALPLRYHGIHPEAKIKRMVDEWLERMRIGRYANNLPAALSAGLKRRASYIRCMITDSIYYFWDEPTEGVDEGHAKLIIKTLEERKHEGVGSLFSTQDASFLGQVADRVIVLKDGKIPYDGPLKGGRIPVEFETEGMLRG